MNCLPPAEFATVPLMLLPYYSLALAALTFVALVTLMYLTLHFSICLTWFAGAPTVALP